MWTTKFNISYSKYSYSSEWWLRGWCSYNTKIQTFHHTNNLVYLHTIHTILIHAWAPLNLACSQYQSLCQILHETRSYVSPCWLDLVNHYYRIAGNFHGVKYSLFSWANWPQRNFNVGVAYRNIGMQCRHETKNEIFTHKNHRFSSWTNFLPHKTA